MESQDFENRSRILILADELIDKLMLEGKVIVEDRWPNHQNSDLIIGIIKNRLQEKYNDVEFTIKGNVITLNQQ